MMQNRYLTISFFILFFAHWGASELTGQCNHPDDYVALRALYLATNGDNWINHSGWPDAAQFTASPSPIAGTDLSEWYGVQCNESGRVVWLGLSNNQLSGSIPAAIGNLSDLQNIYFFNNQLSGDIPTTMGNLSNLTGIYLSNNQLSGSIPETFGNLNNLQSIFLQRNRFSACFPAELQTFCSLGFSANIFQPGYNFTNNPGLPWGGDFSRFCQGESQIGASCDDGNAITDADHIQADCTCAGTLPPTCDDGIQNGEETAIDCGGSDCSPCPCIHPDLEALLALYDSTNGPNWTNNNGWATDAVDSNCNPCNWFGIQCNAENRVSTIILTANQLSGSIPAEIGNLSHLTSLSLNSNQLSGSIPVEVANLSSLTQLDFSYNQLSGSIPVEVSNLTNLTQLNFSFNQLSGSIPAETGNLTNLVWLNLANNQLSGSLPAALGNLINLERFYLAYNQLSGCFPEALLIHCSLGFSVSFSQNGYFLWGNPGLPWFGDFSRYCQGETQIGVSCDDGNAATEIDQIQADCNCAGSVPTCDDGIQNNEELAIDCGGPNCAPCACDHPDFIPLLTLYNSTNGPNWFDNTGWAEGAAGTNCDPCFWYGVECRNNRVSKLYLHLNNLKYSIPPILAELDSLEILLLNSNLLTGSIPEELGNLSKLKELYLHFNQLSGHIPETIANLENLTHLFLSSNELNGNIPDALGNLSALRVLSLHNNLLSDSIPPTLGNLSNLTRLDLGSNRLSGNIPLELGNLTNLTWFSLYNNQLSGGIPETIGNLSNITVLGLGRNQLVDTIPLFLANLPLLELLSLESNGLTGNIPEILGTLSNLRRLDLGSNQLSGRIPPELGDLTNLTWLNLANNQLSGPIPVEIGNLNNLGRLSLLNNQLSGCFPEEMSNHCSLGFVYSGTDGYNLLGNPGLPWGGDFSRFCQGESQIGASCDDGNAITDADHIQADCTCAGTLPPTCDDGIQNGEETAIDCGGPDCALCPCGHPDLEALLALYDSTNGPNWTNNHGWVTDTVDSNCNPCNWFGIQCNEENRVSHIALSANQLNGNIPAEIGNLSYLTSLLLNSNQLSGSIPVEVANLSNLTQLDLSLNQISGNIPETLGNLSDLTVLNLQSNRINNSIPRELGNLTNLGWLNLANNQLSGSIPTELGDLSNLTSLWLHLNQLSGSIPAELGNLSNLTTLFLFVNQLSGNIPQELGNLSNLERFYLQNNQLSGCFPEELLAHCSLGFSAFFPKNGYNLTGNPELPWGGDFTRFCNGEGNCDPTQTTSPDGSSPNILVFPNPTTDFIQISETEDIVAISLLTSQGVLINTFSAAFGRIDVSRLSSGLYILRIKTRNGSAFAYRFVKI